jgi:hypothetical protein
MVADKQRTAHSGDDTWGLRGPARRVSTQSRGLGTNTADEGGVVASPARARWKVRLMGQRVALMMTVAFVCAGGGSALLASPALAGDVNTDTGVLEAALYNVTPYPMTLVAAGTPGTTPQNPNGGNFWNTYPAASIPAGGGMIYRIDANENESGGICFGDYLLGYDAYMTYRVDVLGDPPDPPEYVTLAISQARSHSPTGCLGHFPVGDQYPHFDVYITSAPPPSNYDPAASPGTPPAAVTPSPQLTYTHNVPYLYDQSLQIAGDYQVDAANDLGAPFVNVLNTLCTGGTANTSCSFTQTGPLTWGIGPAVKVGQALNCVVTGQANPGSPPPPTDPNWFEVEYNAAQSASLSVGGSLTVGAEFDLFDTISGSLSVKIEAEHEWQEVKTYTRSSKVYIPANNLASIWLAPVVGKVTGTLVVSTGSAKFTATNFSETRSGVSKDDLTPAFNVITKIRPMTTSEYQQNCAGQSSTALGSTKALGSPQTKPAVGLVPGVGMAKVSLGQTQAQVLKQLGQPSVKRFLLDPCRGLEPGCDATAGVGGRWSYRQLTVVFGPELRVSGLIYRGPRLSANGVGVGASINAVRAAYPDASCAAVGNQRSCTVPGALAGRAVKTVFGFVKTRAGRYDCDRVLMYVMSTDNREVKR